MHGAGALLYCLAWPAMIAHCQDAGPPGWSHFLVPFYFNIVHPYRFLRKCSPARYRFPAMLLDLLAFTVRDGPV